MGMKFQYLLALALPVCISKGQAQAALQRLDPVGFEKVEIVDHFWKPKIDKVATKTLEACIYQTAVKTPRIRNFEKVARGKGEPHEGIFYDDSDVFKAIEAMAYAIQSKANPKLEAIADEWIDKIAAAQLPDGYLNTWYTLKGLDQRWTDMSMHEDYNGGHMIEAGVAYYQATGKRKLLDVCIKWADHFDSLFGPGKRHWVTGHQELELALVKLYKVTNDKKYLDMAGWLLSERGHGYAKGYTWTDWKDTAYAQDVVPVKQQSEITGHAVRAMYMYTGAADVAAQTGDQAYMQAMRRVWEDVVYRNMYITGGIGSSGSNEGFSNDYDLPNEQAYCETCASVGMVFWNQRMNALTGNSEYMDVLERVLYNGALDGLSMSGDRFFYGNPLASDGRHFRREWFGTACCPANIARLVASLGNYIYAHTEKDLYVNLFVGSRTQLSLNNVAVNVSQQTDYPWNGKVQIAIDPAKATQFAVRIRIPGWVERKAVPGDLYKMEDGAAVVGFAVNGSSVSYKEVNGYAVIDRAWKKGDVLSFEYAMPVTKVVSRAEVKQNEGRIALQRGPLVYCVEGADNNGTAWDFIVPPATVFETQEYRVLDEKVMSISMKVPALSVSSDGTRVQTAEKRITAIPYYAWANRGKNEMQVWLPASFQNIKINR
jgi:DUF1680 family protein